MELEEKPSDKPEKKPADKSGVAEKPSFYSRDEGPLIGDASTSEGKKYMGEERRRNNRRITVDRREEVRFELDKDDRRQTDGRRKDDKAPKFW